MILVEITINNVINRISDEYCYLTHQWDRKIKEIQPPRYSMAGIAGGYVKPESGSITISPQLFENDYFPPKSCPITISVTDTTEEAAVLIFSGTAHRQSVDRKGVTYGLFGEEYDQELDSTIWLLDTLDNIFDMYCASAYLGLTFNNDNARATSPTIHSHFEKGTLLIDLLNKIAETTNHIFYIKNNVLYLVDMFLGNGELIRPLGKYYEPTYKNNPNYKKFESEAIKKYNVFGTYIYGENEISDVASCTESLYLRVGDNSGNDQLYLFHTRLIEYDVTATYKTMIKFRRSAGSGLIYCGIIGVASDRVTLVDRNGTANYALGSNHVCANPTISNNIWYEYIGYSRGIKDPSDYFPSPDLSDPGTLFTGSVYFRPFFLVNYNGVAGKFDIEYFAVYKVDPTTGEILEECLYDVFETISAADWQNYNGSGNRDLSTAVAEAKTIVEGHLNRRKTIIESQQVQIKLDLLASNIPEPGQAIYWNDSVLPPDTTPELSVDGIVYARNITFDIDNFKVIVEGEAEVGAVLFYDEFTDGNNTGVIDHTPDLNIGCTSWAIPSPQTMGPIISSNKTSSGGAADDMAVIDPNLYNGVITLLAYGTTITYYAIPFRLTDGNDGYQVRHSSTTLYISSYITGVVTTLASKTLARVSGEEIKIVMNNDLIKVFVDGVLQLNYDSCTGRGTMHGIIHITGYDVGYDNFRFSQIV